MNGHDFRHQSLPEVDTPVHKYETQIQTPTNHGGLDTTYRNILGTPAAIGCATCHQPGSAPALAKRAGTPKEFHPRSMLRHGKLACTSCHAPDNPGELHLADTTPVAMADSMQLCAQCHGPQKRNYDHGAHGGMRGYWDTARGPRERNHCVACHSAHAPRYPAVLPVKGPRDRFAKAKHTPGSALDVRFGEPIEAEAAP
ncbi:MAG: hypothetical protein R3C68_03650 [Myxococcota bacterium]